MDFHPYKKATVPRNVRAHSTATGSQDSGGSCRYHSKQCSNPRSMKLTGKYHSLCTEHRARANGNQRKLDRKKRKKNKGTVPYEQERVVHVPPPRPRSERFQLPKLPSLMRIEHLPSNDQYTYVYTPQSHTPQSHTPLNYTPQNHTPSSYYTTDFPSQERSVYAVHHHSSQVERPPTNGVWKSLAKQEWNQGEILSRHHHENQSSFLENRFQNNIGPYSA